MKRNVIKKEKFGNNVVDVMYDVVFNSKDKMFIKENRERFYREGFYVINKLLKKKGDEISFVELKKVFESNRYVSELYRSIMVNNVGYNFMCDFYDYSDRFLNNIKGMISLRNFDVIKKSNGRLFLVKEFDGVLKKDDWKYKIMNNNYMWVNKDYKEINYDL